MSTIFYIVLTGLGFLTFKYCCFNYGSHRSVSYGKSAKLKWNDVKNFYCLNPLRWRYESIVENDCSVLKTNYKVLLYNPTDYWSASAWNNLYSERDQLVRIRLSPIDYLKFIWCSKFKNPESIEGIEAVLDCAQKDIDRLKRISNKEIDEANKRMEDIEEKLKEGVTLEI